MGQHVVPFLPQGAVRKEKSFPIVGEWELATNGDMVTFMDWFSLWKDTR
jgi:hypothetical protein